MLASIVIRVKNERENLKKVLEILKDQTLQDFEVVIVDDNSTDGSEKISFDYFPKDRIQVVKVPKGKFTYPYASNLGAKAARGKYIVFLSAHSYPISNTWLEDGLKHFKESDIGGVFGYPIAHADTNIFEKLWYNIGTLIFLPKFKKYLKYRSGVMGTTNAIIPKELWLRHGFDEIWNRGGEDIEWAVHFMKKGYFMIQDQKFMVRHSHHLNLLGLFKQMLKYHSFREYQKLRKL